MTGLATGGWGFKSVPAPQRGPLTPQPHALPGLWHFTCAVTLAVGHCVPSSPQRAQWPRTPNRSPPHPPPSSARVTSLPRHQHTSRTEAGRCDSPCLLPLFGGHKAKLPIAQVLKRPTHTAVRGGKGDPAPTPPAWPGGGVLTPH